MSPAPEPDEIPAAASLQRVPQRENRSLCGFFRVAAIGTDAAYVLPFGRGSVFDDSLPTEETAVTLEVGDRLGPYEVIGPLGSGGMGEVYRARDPRLGRDVAIKVLPAALSTDPERLKRFEREARSASSLTH